MNTEKYPFQDPRLDPNSRAEDIVSRLSLTERIDQMLFEAPAIPRLGIPAYNWWNECLHGVGRAGLATVFPQAIALAATFDPMLMGEVATVISDEARAKHHANAAGGDVDIYHGLTFWSPNINIFRDPRWGRGHETYGECPYLTGRLGVAFVQGLQGNHPHYLKTVATPKHYAVHSGPEAKRHEFNTVVSPKDLHETYLPAFKECVIEGQAASVMGAYNRTNGEPCCTSKTLLQRILRDDWGFDGYVVSDCGAINDIHAHHKVTASPEESAALAVQNGCDLNCGRVYEALKGAVAQGLVSEDEIDRAVKRLFTARFQLGMFDSPEDVPYTAIPYDVVDCPEHQALALDAARASIVLLKNEAELLPLSKNLQNIAVIGPNADDREILWGNYNGTASRWVTPIEGIRAKLGPGARVWYAPGCDHVGSEHAAQGKATRGFAEALTVAEKADVIILCLGLSPRLEGEEGDAMNADAAGDRRTIRLPGAQHALLAALHALKKPIVLVNISGSAVAIPWAQDHIPAIVQMFYPGQAGGTALADVLFGDHAPSGRLPVTFYRSLDQLPPFEDYAMEARTYRFFQGSLLYPFGFGLSYTQFNYESPAADADTISSGEPVILTATVRNVGSHPGHEVVQVYLSHTNPPMRAPIRQLVAVQRIHLEPGAQQDLVFTIEPERLSLVDDNGQTRQYPGDVQFSIGGSQPDPVSMRLGAAKPVSITVIIT